MGLFTRWVELWITQDSVQFAEVCAKLAHSGIAFREKIQHLGHSTRRSGLIGSIGENARYANMYQIYVKKADLERAQSAAFRNQ